MTSLGTSEEQERRSKVRPEAKGSKVRNDAVRAGEKRGRPNKLRVLISRMSLVLSTGYIHNLLKDLSLLRHRYHLASCKGHADGTVS